MKTSEKVSRYGASSELPRELSNAAWLAEEGVSTPRDKRWEFQEGEIYQIGHGVSQRSLLIYLRDEGIHHVFRSYRAEWITTYTDQQLYGMEVLRMEKKVKPCPHCGGKVLKLEVIRDKAEGHFTGQVSCLDKGCGAVSRWQITLPKRPVEKDGAKQEAAAKELLVAAWNRRG